jgi:hypothetical protein
MLSTCLISLNTNHVLPDDVGPATVQVNACFNRTSMTFIYMTTTVKRQSTVRRPLFIVHATQTTKFIQHPTTARDRTPTSQRRRPERIACSRKRTVRPLNIQQSLSCAHANGTVCTWRVRLSSRAAYAVTCRVLDVWRRTASLCLWPSFSPCCRRMLTGCTF